MDNKKYLVTIEFRYGVIPQSEYSTDQKFKTVTIGVFDDIDEACSKGNEALVKLSKHFNFRGDRFSKNGGVFGSFNNLICNYCAGRTKVSVFCKIDTLNYEDLYEVMEEVIESQSKYNKWAKNNMD